MESMNDQTAVARQLAKYKPRLQKQCIVKAVSGGFTVLTIILLVFVPFFEVRSTSELGNAVDKLLGTFTFSLFDDTMHIVKLLFDGKLFGGDGPTYVVRSLSLFQLVEFLFLVIGATLIAVDSAKDISKLLNIDNSVLETYDKVKSKRDETIKQLNRINKMGWRFLMCGVIEGAVTIVLLKAFGGDSAEFSDLLTNPLTRDPDAFGASYFTLMNSITPLILFGIFAAAFAIIALIVQRKLYNQVKMDILKDDYHLGTRNESAAYRAYPETQPPYPKQPQQPYPGSPYPKQPQQPYPRLPYSGQPYAQPYPPQFYGQPYPQPYPEGGEHRKSADAPSKEPPDRKPTAEEQAETLPQGPSAKDTE